MPTLFEIGAYRVVIYPNDHGPAHVHVVGPGGHGKFELGRTTDNVALIESEGIPRSQLRRIAAEIIDRYGECRRSWSKYHGKKGADRKGG